MTSEHKVHALCAEHPQQVAVGTCGRCGSYYCHACAAGMHGYCSGCHRSRAYVAWEDPTLGVWDRYFRTVKSTVVELPKFADELPESGGFLQPLAFAMVPTLISVFAGSALMGLLIGFVDRMFNSTNPNTVTPLMLGVITAIYAMFGAVAYLTYLCGWPLLLLASARVFGSRHVTYRGAFKILCYSSGLNCLYFVPLVNLLVLFYHYVVSSVSMAAHARTSVARGFGIIGVPAVLAGGCFAGAYGLLLAAAMGSGNP